MRLRHRLVHSIPASLLFVLPLAFGLAGLRVTAQETLLTKPAVVPTNAGAPFTPPGSLPGNRPYPFDLPTALRLAQAESLDVALAAQRIRIAVAQLDRAKVLWLPTIVWGGDYFRHDGQLQDIVGNVFGTSRSTVMAGAGPIMVFAATDAIFEPLAARQTLRAQEAGLRAVANDTTLAVAEAYFNVQQARGELAGAEDAVRRAEDIVGRAEKLAGELVPRLELARTRAELARRRQTVHSTRERWRVASTELVRILRLDPVLLVDPVEPPSLEIPLVPTEQCVDDLIVQALGARPELTAQQALVQATIRRLKQERLRPLVPSVLLRGAATNPAGTLSSGFFAGGVNGRIADSGARNTMDVQLLWELQNLGFGNRARVNVRRAEHDTAILELFRTQDAIAAEVVRAHAQVQESAARITEAAAGLRDAVESATQNVEGMSQTKKAGNVVLLVIRPQEAVAAVQALGQAYADYYGAVADFNRAQFRLYRALGNPAAALGAESASPCPAEKQ